MAYSLLSSRALCPILGSTSSLLARLVGTKRRDRGDEWHVQKNSSKRDKLRKIEDEYAKMSPMLKMFQRRLDTKDSVTSLRGLFVEQKIKENVGKMRVDIMNGQKDTSTDLPWQGYKRDRPGHSKHGQWLFRLKRRSCYNPNKIRYARSACPVCATGWYPVYHEVDKLRPYLDTSTNKVVDSEDTGVCTYKQRVLQEAISAAQSKGMLPFYPNPKHNNSSPSTFGKDRTEVYGTRQRYHNEYRHLPGNIHYEKENPHWDHVKVPTVNDSDTIRYE